MNLRANVSTSSLLLPGDDASNLSLIESEPSSYKSTCSVRHRYNTRLAAKFLRQSLSESLETEFPSVSRRSNSLGRRLRNSQRLLGCQNLTICSQNTDRTLTIQTQRVLKPVEAMDLSGRPFRCGCDQSGILKYAIRALTFISMILAALMLNQLFLTITENKTDLITIKSQMAGLQNEMCETKQKTERKLNKIERILVMMDKRYKSEFQSDCDSSEPPTPCVTSLLKDFKNEGSYSRKKEDKIRRLVQEMLTEYSADKTGRTDYAMETAGGCIVKVREGEPFCPEAKDKKYLGAAVCPSPINQPSAILKPSTYPGECWAFKGCTAAVVIQLLGRVFIDSVSLEHIPKAMAPSGEISNAPREFMVTALNDPNDQIGELLGKFYYDNEGMPVQTYKIVQPSKSYRFVEFRVLANHGSPYYTCVYRFRVHGVLDTSIECEDQ